MIYLDNAATSFPKAPGVSEAVKDFLDNTGANAGRSSYSQARQSSRIIYQARKLLAEILQVTDEERICFTMNATQALNIAIKGLVKPGMTVLTSGMEHNSVMRPLRWLESNSQVKINQFSLLNDAERWQQKLAEKPDVIIVSAASNVNGMILPFEEIARNAKKYRIPVILDAAQALGTLPINGNDFDIVCFPGHKGLLGPMGTGGLYISPGLEPESLFQGGTGSRSSEEFQPEMLPDRMESGTANIPGIAGLKAALEFVLKTGINEIQRQKQHILSLLIDGLVTINEIEIHGSLDPTLNAGAISITSSTMTISELALVLDRADIATRMGLHCAPAAHKTLGTFEQGGTIRLSPGYFTTEFEIAETVRILKEIHRGR